jgi:hypothetical protein
VSKSNIVSELFSENLTKGRSLPQHHKFSALPLHLVLWPLFRSSIQNYLWSASCHFTYRPTRPLSFHDHIFSTSRPSGRRPLFRSSIQNYLWSASCHFTCWSARSEGHSNDKVCQGVVRNSVNLLCPTRPLPFRDHIFSTSRPLGGLSARLPFTPVFVALTSIINTELPMVGELLLHLLVLPD